ncbi:MAG TPA: hypothetical protein DEQ34_08980 [Balneolaceae bacterium]|nr:hypothetical protein [Balneolaceae bacterium]|tara:strand:+ start:198611 stop:199075 length:465 start_codon:yes stop_codon:yes gene_type:complete
MNVAYQTSGHRSKTVHSSWVIELNDLSTDQALLGFQMSGNYVMVGITSPINENKISVHSLPEDEWTELHIPLNLQHCDAPLKGKINFCGLSKLHKSWSVQMIDHRTGAVYEINEIDHIQIELPTRINNKGKLKLLGYSKDEARCPALFELLITK